MTATTDREFTVLFPFCGLGAGAMGFLESSVTLFGKQWKFRSLGGIDIDDEACKDFVYLTKSPALCADIAEMTVQQLRDFAGDKVPDVVFLSPPCKASSKLISDAKAREPKYEKLNRLSEDWIRLMLEAWPTPPRLLLFENVPNIVTRAKAMLKRVKAMLRAAGYVLHDGFHECGSIGGLAQKRKRWLMVARHASQVAPLLYQPDHKRIRGCGEVIGPLPMPGDPAGGPMHQLPKISWLNWVRLALIPAGGDWRDLPGVLAEGQSRREVFKRHEVCDWTEPTGTIGGSGSNGVEKIADPRVEEAAALVSPLGLTPNPDRHLAKYAVGDWKRPAKTVTGATRPGSGSLAVNDPRVDRFGNVDRVTPWADPVGTITHSPAPSSGGGAVADPRIPQAFKGGYGVQGWEKPAATVTGEASVSSGAAIADPRAGELGVPGVRFNNINRVTEWSDPVGTICSRSAPASGGPAVADPRVEIPKSFKDGYGVLDWEAPSGTVTGSAAPTRGRFSVPDPRSEKWFNGFLRVVSWTEPARTVTGKPASGIVADPRVPIVPPTAPFDKAYGVLAWTDPSHTVAGGSDVGQGAYAVADVRDLKLGCTPHSGAYGVLSWEEASKTITGVAGMDNGPFAIADVRLPDAAPMCIVRDVRKAPVGGVPIIVAADGTWHRPLTTYELGILQDLPPMVDGKPLQLAGTNSTRHRERIGNAVPRGTGRGIGNRMLSNLAAAEAGAFTLSADGSVWVAPKRTRGKVGGWKRVPAALVAARERSALLGCVQ